MDKKMQLSITVSLRSDFGDRLEVREDFEMGQIDFLEMAKILGQFHDLAQKLKSKK